MVHAQPSVKGAFDVEIKGRLQELPGTPFVKLSVGGGPLVAGVRYIANPTIAEALFSYRRAAQLGSHDFIFGQTAPRLKERMISPAPIPTNGVGRR
jgi:hypothetical protein